MATIFRGPIITRYNPPDPSVAISAQVGPNLRALLYTGSDTFYGLGGATNFDWPLPNHKYPPLSAGDLRSWTAGYNPNLVGQDRFPPGKRQTELAPLGADYHVGLRTWIVAPQPVAQTVAVPFGQDDWPLPQTTSQPVDLRSWTAAYNVNLIARDQLPVGDARIELSPGRLLPPGAIDLNWTRSYNLNLIGKDRLPVGAVTTALTVLDAPRANNLATWLWQYNASLIGQDAFPAGEQRTENPSPPQPYYDRASFQATYNRNLIGRDALPVRQQDWPLPAPPADGRTWIQAVNLALSTGSISTAPFRQLDWPIALGPLPPPQTFAAWFNQNLIGQDALPAGAAVTALSPAGHPFLDRAFAVGFNKNLIGKDQLPSGAQRTDVAPQPVLLFDRASFTATFNKNLIAQDRLPIRQTDWPLATPPADGRSWICPINLALTSAPQPAPFRQLDWPINLGSLPPVQSFAAWFNLNLVGRDRLPVGTVRTDLTVPAPPAPIDLNWARSYNASLIGKDRLPSGAQITGPGTQQPPYYDRASFAASYNRNLIGRDELPIRQQQWPLSIAPSDARSWLQAVNLALNTTTTAVMPFRQLDWPVSRGALPPIQAFAAWLNLNLFGNTTYNVSVAEPASATDALDASAIFAASVVEGSSATDTLDASAVFACVIVESLGATDTASSLAVLGATVTEALGAIDTVSSVAVFPCTISETAGASDTANALAIFVGSLAEAAAASDTASAQANLVTTITEALSATDAADAIGVFGVTLTENGFAFDTITADGITAEAPHSLPFLVTMGRLTAR